LHLFKIAQHLNGLLNHMFHRRENSHLLMEVELAQSPKLNQDLNQRSFMKLCLKIRRKFYQIRNMRGLI
jgi:hypothetical protein